MEIFNNQMRNLQTFNKCNNFSKNNEMSLNLCQLRVESSTMHTIKPFSYILEMRQSDWLLGVSESASILRKNL